MQLNEFASLACWTLGGNGERIAENPVCNDRRFNCAFLNLWYSFVINGHRSVRSGEVTPSASASAREPDLLR